MVYGPIALILNDSVAGCDPEEGITFIILIWLHLWWLEDQFGVGRLLVLFIGELVEHLFLLDFSIVKEKLKRRLAHWNHMLEDVPKDTL
jgi:hypothetical protein